MAQGDDSERTEAATPKRRQEFRDRGQVARSREVPVVLILGSFAIYLYLEGDQLYHRLSTTIAKGFERAAVPGGMDQQALSGVLEDSFDLFLWIMAPILLLSLVITLASYILQTGWVLSAKSLTPEFSQLNPFTRFQQIFLTSRLWVNSLLNTFKVVLMTSVIWMVMKDRLEELPGLFSMPPLEILTWISSVVLEILYKTVIFFSFIALADYLYQWWTLEKEMRMTKHELREEYKEVEGNPQMKSHMRARMRDITFNKMIQQVPKADVVVTNPTHYAVALRYSQGSDSAPVVVAKGSGFWAERIKEIARQNHVEIVEDRHLARAIFKSVKVGAGIPHQLYRAVAELLAYVYGIKRRRQGAGRGPIKPYKPFTPPVAEPGI